MLCILILSLSSINARFCLVVTSINSVLLILSDNLFAISQFSKLASSLFDEVVEVVVVVVVVVVEVVVVVIVVVVIVVVVVVIVVV